MSNLHLEILSPDGNMADDANLDVVGPSDLSEGAELLLRFTRGPARKGWVISIQDSGARAVIEVEGARWWLSRRTAISVGSVSVYPWLVGGREI